MSSCLIIKQDGGQPDHICAKSGASQLEGAVDPKREGNKSSDPENHAHWLYTPWSTMGSHRAKAERVLLDDRYVPVIGQLGDADEQSRQGEQGDDAVVDLEVDGQCQDEYREASQREHFVPLVDDEFSNQVCHAGAFADGDCEVGVPTIIYAICPGSHHIPGDTTTSPAPGAVWIGSGGA